MPFCSRFKGDHHHHHHHHHLHQVGGIPTPLKNMSSSVEIQHGGKKCSKPPTSHNNNNNNTIRISNRATKSCRLQSSVVFLSLRFYTSMDCVRHHGVAGNQETMDFTRHDMICSHRSSMLKKKIDVPNSSRTKTVFIKKSKEQHRKTNPYILMVSHISIFCLYVEGN